jgi:uncharacterized cysteine cluster protein YcgN (CxxCxxCC family)
MCKSCHTNWEKTCTKCGLCCHEKAVYGHILVIDLDSWCEFFDPKTKQCTVYAERFVKSTRCRKVNYLRAMFSSYLPESCAYVQWAAENHIRFSPNRMLRLIHSKNCPPDDPDTELYEIFGA